MINFFLQLGIILVFSIIFSLQDLRRHAINTYLIIPAMLIELIFQGYVSIVCAHNDNYFFLQILSTCLSAAFYWAVFFISKYKIGFGDILFSFFTGFCINLKFLWLTFLIPVLFLGIYILFEFVVKKNKDLKTIRIPYIPFMASGLVISFLIQFFVN